MGYGAFVNCNCYKKGLVKTEPPYKQYLNPDDYEFVWDLDIPEEVEIEKAIEMDAAFDEWKANACEHEDMKYVDEHLTNIAGMGQFKDAIHQLGGSTTFPVLTKYLPTSNDGTLPSEYAIHALEEVTSLGEAAIPGKHIVLHEEQTQTQLASCVAGSHSLFVLNGKDDTCYGIDQDGFFILQNCMTNARIVFRSNHFSQTKVAGNRYQLTDYKNGDIYVGEPLFLPKEGESHPFYTFSITPKKTSVDEVFGNIIETLKRLLQASIETGNPVVWC